MSKHNAGTVSYIPHSLAIMTWCTLYSVLRWLQSSKNPVIIIEALSPFLMAPSEIRLKQNKESFSIKGLNSFLLNNITYIRIYTEFCLFLYFNPWKVIICWYEHAQKMYKVKNIPAQVLAWRRLEPELLNRLQSWSKHRLQSPGHLVWNSSKNLSVS